MLLLLPYYAATSLPRCRILVTGLIWGIVDVALEYRGMLSGLKPVN